MPSPSAALPPSPPAAGHHTTGKDSRRALVSSFLGSTVEYYDFLLYAAAAGLVFPKLFFSADMDPTLGTILSFVILLAGYISRPIGGVLFGHFGDKYGRKNMLFITLMMMGLVSVAIGLMPTYAAIGVAAPLLLVFLRVVQGLAVGGEWAGATLMAAEHVKEKNRGFAASIAVTGGPTGSVLATLILGLFAGLPEDDFLSWGWRIPFLLSAALVIIGLYLRYRVTESPDFVEARAAGTVHTGVPILRVLKKYPLSSLYGILAAAGPLFMQALLAVFMVPYVVGTGAVDRQTALMMLTASSFVHIFAIPFFAWLSDKFGRRPVMLAGAGISVALVFPMFAMFNSGSFWLIALAFMVGNPIIQASMYGPIGAFLAEKFDTQDRYTGVSLTFQLGSVLGAGTAPLLATWLIDLDNGRGTDNIAWYFIALIAVGAASVILSKETRGRSAREQTARDDADLASVG
ncbi:MFS transporter [Arthrobacter sunyaminii]|uniref:MHS family MFS transporter n=1 Tax=Arthrobacter sunyaminii TaxID=2816859 RepID=A0A975S689_9MICC|nr:MFS transporter [Arthrobacter sunyaminii]MBO0898036.1 MHS family MFS transporter [Arthrobacter sunyaminii]MBO0909778.1 MHS family MFS transporter [Arthrobacter sunyaminii]QWQ36570.1 MHS family MFS transporter [Arthrobacter sunyaminii]